MNKYLHLILVLISILYLLSGCNRTPSIQPSGKSVKIGIIAPLSGDHLYKGKEGLKGINYVLQNTPLLQNGDKIEIIIKDDKNNPKLSAKALEELVSKHNVSAILTLSGSNAVLGLTKYADTFKTPIISLLATHPRITRDNNYVSQLGFNDHFQGLASALFVHDELLFDRVAIFKNSKNVYSTSLANTFKQKFESVRGQVIHYGEFIDNPTKLNRKLIELRNKKVQLIYLPINAKEVIEIITALDELNWRPKIMGSDGLLSNILTKYHDDIHKLNGIISTDFYSSDVPLTEFGVRTKQSYESSQGNLTSYSMMGIEGMTLLINAMNHCAASLTTKCIHEQINSGIAFNGFIGKINLNPDGVAQRALLVNEIDNGQLKYIVQIY